MENLSFQKSFSDYRGKVLEYAQLSAFEKAKDIVEDFISGAADFDEAYEFLKAINFLMEKLRSAALSPKGLHRAKETQKILNEFEAFSFEGNFEKILKDLKFFKKGVLRQILENYLDYHESSKIEDKEILLEIAEIYLEMEDYKTANETLLYIYKNSRFNSKVIAYLADSYHFLGQNDFALKLFQEAFAYDPAQIEIENLKAPFLGELKRHLLNEGFVGGEINLWFLSYGLIYGYFERRLPFNEDKMSYVSSKRYRYEQLFLKSNYPNKELPYAINYSLLAINLFRGKEKQTDSEAFEVKRLFDKIIMMDKTLGDRLLGVYNV